MNKYKFIFYVLWYFITGYDCKIFIPPKIFQENNIVLNTGDNLTLSCEGMEPLTWTIVNYNKINYNKSSIIINYWNKTEKSNFMFASILRIQNVSYVNTGFFYCHGAKANKDDIQRATNIYVYIRDENRLSIVPREELSLFIPKSKFDFNIPCLPTSPDIKVDLFTTYGEYIVPIESDFDPHTGFKIHLFREDMQVFCMFSRNQQIENITIYLDDSDIEEIKTSYIRSQNIGNMAYVGETLILNFTAIIFNNKYYSPTWFYDFDHIKNNRALIINNPLINVANGKLITSSLIINNVTKSDEGVYTFIYTSGDYESIYINIADKALQNIFPKINSTKSEITINATDDIILACEASLSINWYINDQYGAYDENVNITTYQQSDNIHKSILTIKNATIENAGYFICRPEYEMSDTSYRSARVYIFVHDQNSLSKFVGDIDEPIMFTLNTIFYIPCISSSPDVNVTLFDADGKQILTSYNHKEGFSFISTRIGLYKYKCVYQRQNYTESFSLPISIVRDPIYETVSMLESPEKNFVHIGDKLQLNCSLIIYSNVWKNYSSLQIKWIFPETLTNDTDVIEDEILYEIANGHVLIRRLFIEQADIQAEGDYECIIENGINNETTSIYKYINVVDPNIGDLKIHLPDRKYIVIDETLVLLCTYRVNYNTKFSLHWEFQNRTVQNTFRRIQSNLEIHEDIYGLVGNIYLTIKNVTHQDAGTYKCIVNNDLGSTKYYEQIIRIYEPVFPNIIESNLNNTQWKLKEGGSLNLYCLADGIPVPNITWFKNDIPWIIKNNNSRITFLENNTKIKFVYTKREDSGKYSCKVSNIKGEIQKNVMLTIFTDSTWTTVQISLIFILIVILIVLLITLVIKLYKERKRQLEFKIAGLHQFEEGAVDNINPDLGVDAQAELLPYDKNFEIPRDKLKLGKQLGSGFFGVVFQAEATNIFPEENKKVVAVKMVQRNADYMHIKALLSELKIMIHIGKHINVLNLLGACTRNIAKRELLVVVEYCRFGNLHDFVLKHRNNFINQIDPETGLIDLDIGENILKHFDYNKSAKTNMQVQYYNTNNCIHSGKKQDSTKAICTYDLLYWSLQISQGMKYLASRKVLHGDLAARNILLTDDNVVKICDFGLAKNIYKNNNYKKSSDSPLPVRWMAPESIVDRLFSIESDVWSFGIVLWELFSLARVPYPEMEIDNEFYNNLLNGYRMSKPDFATDKMYQIMLNCWNSNPLDRPTFITLCNEIGNMLNTNTQQNYVELNRTYVNIKNQNDLLLIMKQPNYENIILTNTYNNIKNNLQNNSNPRIQYTHKDININYAMLDLH